MDSALHLVRSSGHLHRPKPHPGAFESRGITVQRPISGTGNHASSQTEFRSMTRARELSLLGGPLIRAPKMSAKRRKRRQRSVVLQNNPSGGFLVRDLPAVHAASLKR